jgi:hypothetical protein
MADVAPATPPNPGIDLNSSAQTRVPRIIFKDSREHDFGIIKFTCLKPCNTCIEIKKWLLRSLPNELRHGNRALQMVTLKLSELQPETKGSLVLLEDAARLARPDGMRISILALILPGDEDIRWFYTVNTVSPLLTDLTERGFITAPMSRDPTPDHRVWEHVKTGEQSVRRRIVDGQEQKEGPDHHCRLYNFFSRAFLAAIAIPHHPEFVEALKFTDYSPEMVDPDTALQRLQADEVSAHSKDGKDLSDDRYLLELHPAEREISSLIHLHCAGYILMKRKFFFEFYIEMMHTTKDVEGRRQRVRSDRAHQQWLERTYEWRSSRAKRCVDGWKVLGLLDERKMFAWIRNGGMLPYSDPWVEDGDDDASA